ncbi:hypothetical protein [Desulfogranum japonicum]|uniref:hypothetical protein n=1 Tax=Desulfogranum japonicum TaxID=231447 RepID=UPI00054F15E8|nr:hypothetical protein [Desulfogranum japonicum]
MSLKPAVSRSVHLFAAPFLWTAVGFMLIYRGCGWIPVHSRFYLLTLAMLVGTLKSVLILDKTARKSIQRIAAFQDGTCLGAVYSWKSWLLVFGMMLTGVVVRRIGAVGSWTGTLYCAVGWALCCSSRLGWQAWVRSIRGNGIVK